MLGEREISYVRRTSAVDPVTGRNAITSAASVTFRASVQPLPGRERELLPEGLRARDAVVIYTTTTLRTAEAATGILEDLVTVDGATYAVHAAGVYDSRSPIAHTRAVCVKVQP